MDYQKKLIDLAADRTAALNRAENALNGKNIDTYNAEMTAVENINNEIERYNRLVEEQNRNLLSQPAPSGAEARDIAEGRAELLQHGDKVTFSNIEVMRMLNSTTLASGTLVLPTAGGSNIRDPLGNGVSSIVDQVNVVDLTGTGGLDEPYVITELDAVGGKVSTNAGKARTASTSPTFGAAPIRPYEVNVTDYVDRNISRLSPASYYDKILGMGMRALRRKAAALIVNGDGQSSPDMYGIKNATNKAGNAIYSAVELTAGDGGSYITESLLDSLFFGYGSATEVGGGARLYLTKPDLKALGQLRNANKERVFKIRPDGGNPNTGMIEDGGNFVPYTIMPDLTSLSSAKTAAVQTMLYGDPLNYELGLFGGYTIRIDDSIKGVERMLTILGDVMLGGNLVVDKGFSIATTK